MRIKKIIADNYGEALTRVKTELGEHAMILSTRSIKFNKDQDAGRTSTMVEITAALDREVEHKTVAAAEPEFANSAPEGWNPDGEIRELRSLIASLLTRTERAQSMGLNETLLPVYEKMINRGIDERVAARIFEMSFQREQRKGGSSVNREGHLAAVMKGAVKCHGPIQPPAAGSRVVALVGPTGAGKTTTIAKLAAHFALQEKKRVVLVTLDTYRMGACEQLEAYGELMRVPVALATNRREFARILDNHADKDIILVDTMGKSHREEKYCSQLKHIFQAAPERETHLVQSAATQEAVVNAGFRQFAPLGIDRVLFTKLDEAVNFGLLFNTAVRHRIPFSYFTTGQRVPEDIEVAAGEKVIRLIFN